MMSVTRRLICCVLALLSLLTLDGFAQGVEGQWVLVKRKLSNGTVLTPPAVIGQFTVHDGLNQMLVFWPTPTGGVASVSAINKWEWTDSQVTVTPVLRILDDGSGKPPMYTVGGSARTVALDRTGTTVSFQHPLDPPFLVWDADKMTATLEGVFVDYWERVR